MVLRLSYQLQIAPKLPSLSFSEVICRIAFRNNVVLEQSFHQQHASTKISLKGSFSLLVL